MSEFSPSHSRIKWSAALARDLRRDGRGASLISAIFAWFVSPSFQLLVLHRSAVRVRSVPFLGAPLSKFFWRWSVSSSGCYLSPTAQIGPGIVFPHPTGIVIGEGVIVDVDVTIYQSVTLGRVHGDRPLYPIIESGVVLYAGAVVVGDVRLGKNCIVGAGSYVNRSAPSGSVLVGSPASRINIDSLVKRH
ncbi:serine O-acetyltransferase [Brevundimonas nasdae]|uniref:serine O-acetyltransferase n=1 Tax=Brevundimonas nasdae TaxID=172043 RepID=UPI0035E3C479